MTKRIVLPTFFHDELALERMRDMLNQRRWEHEGLDNANWDELRILMQDWKASKKHWANFISRRLAAGRSVDFVNGTFNIPTAGRDPILVPYPRRMSRCEHAKGVFLQFVLHPECRRLDGPCHRKKCDHYFIRKTSRENVYCTPRCASLDTATAAVERARNDARKRDATRVKSVIKAFERSREQGDLILKIETETGIRRRRLNTLIEAGLVKLPLKGRRK
jgi:hypothetical protein